MPALEVAVGDGSVLAEVLLGDKLVCVKSSLQGVYHVVHACLGHH